MPKQELNLLQLAAIHMAELGARSAKIVWFEMVQLNPPSDPSRHVPNDVL
jgi:arginase family enzyme